MTEEKTQIWVIVDPPSVRITHDTEENIKYDMMKLVPLGYKSFKTLEEAFHWKAEIEAKIEDATFYACFSPQDQKLFPTMDLSKAFWSIIIKESKDYNEVREALSKFSMNPEFASRFGIHPRSNPELLMSILGE